MNIADYSRENNLEKVKECLENGEDVNLKNEDGETALILASRKGNEEVVKLLEKGG